MRVQKAKAKNKKSRSKAKVRVSGASNYIKSVKGKNVKVSQSTKQKKMVISGGTGGGSSASVAPVINIYGHQGRSGSEGLVGSGGSGSGINLPSIPKLPDVPESKKPVKTPDKTPDLEITGSKGPDVVETGSKEGSGVFVTGSKGPDATVTGSTPAEVTVTGSTPADLTILSAKAGVAAVKKKEEEKEPKKDEKEPKEDKKPKITGQYSALPTQNFSPAPREFMHERMPHLEDPNMPHLEDPNMPHLERVAGANVNWSDFIKGASTSAAIMGMSLLGAYGKLKPLVHFAKRGFGFLKSDPAEAQARMRRLEEGKQDTTVASPITHNASPITHPQPLTSIDQQQLERYQNLFGRSPTVVQEPRNHEFLQFGDQGVHARSRSNSRFYPESYTPLQSNFNGNSHGSLLRTRRHF